MSKLSVNGDRLLSRISELGRIGVDDAGRRTRLACSNTDRQGRDMFAGWARAAGLAVDVDRIGNIVVSAGSLTGTAGNAPLLIGSHIDTVIDAGALDGCYGVLAGLEVLQTLKENGACSAASIAVAAFTNEEGVRFAPDMMGSAVFAGNLPIETALSAVGTDGLKLGDELRRIGYAGAKEPGFFRPRAYLEIHIEQGPILDQAHVDIGVVEAVQGISWRRIRVRGEANHAGTTPMGMRQDAGAAVARIVTFLEEMARAGAGGLVATVGSIRLAPDAINVVPGYAEITVDMRSPSQEILVEAEGKLDAFVLALARRTGCTIECQPLSRTEPVAFDSNLVELVEAAAEGRGASHIRMTSGAGHDAQMIAAITSAVMIFVPSVGGISHNPLERTSDLHLIRGANVLLDTTVALLSH